MASRTESQRKWRQRTRAKKIEAYLAPELVDRLDQLVSDGGYRGRGEALSALIRAHGATPAKQSSPKVLHVERRWDRERCECQTAAGGRCRRKTAVVVKRKVGGKVLAFGACTRHEYKSQPHPSLSRPSTASQEKSGAAGKHESTR